MENERRNTMALMGRAESCGQIKPTVSVEIESELYGLIERFMGIENRMSILRDRLFGVEPSDVLPSCEQKQNATLAQIAMNIETLKGQASRIEYIMNKLDTL